MVDFLFLQINFGIVLGVISRKMFITADYSHMADEMDDPTALKR